MEVIKAKIISKGIRNFSVLPNVIRYMLVFEVIGYYNIHDGSNISEVCVSEHAYNSLEVGDIVLCPMLMESEGLVYDYSYPLKKV